MKCERCDDTGWLCEQHKGPWEGERGCNCPGPGDPCPDCNPLKSMAALQEYHDPFAKPPITLSQDEYRHV